jgi:[ribosomal protein S5]-alanine N-acetyltransferase
MRTLSSDLCALEPLLEAHAPEMFTVLTDPAIYEFEGEAPPSLEKLAAGFRRRETRRSNDGDTVLDWVVRLPSGELSGYVQAIVYQTGVAYVGYEFASKFWRRGIGSSAVRCALSELANEYSVHKFVAVLKEANFRSTGLLKKLGFQPGTPEDARNYGADPDEITLVKCANAA